MLDKSPKRPVCADLSTGKAMPEMFTRSSKKLTSYFPDAPLAKSAPAKYD